MGIDIVSFKYKVIEDGEIHFKNEISGFTLSRDLDALPLFKADADMVYDEDIGYTGCETYQFSMMKVLEKKNIALMKYSHVVIEFLYEILNSGVDIVYIKII